MLDIFCVNLLLIISTFQDKEERLQLKNGLLNEQWTRAVANDDFDMKEDIIDAFKNEDKDAEQAWYDGSRVEGQWDTGAGRRSTHPLFAATAVAAEPP